MNIKGMDLEIYCIAETIAINWHYKISMSQIQMQSETLTLKEKT